MNFILFGPPGVGKSTLIAILKSHGVRAIDLEDVFPSKVRFALPNQLQNVVLGAADLEPRRKYPNAMKILLLAQQPEYEQRREQRDKKSLDSKELQRKHFVSEWFRLADWDFIIDTTDLTAEQTAERLEWFIFKHGGGASHG